jgi:hypothetical protein
MNDGYDDDWEPEDGEGSESSDEDAAETDAVDMADETWQRASRSWSLRTGGLWPNSINQISARHPDYDIDHPGKMKSFVAKNPCDLCLAFFPMELVEPRFAHRRAHAREHDREGLENLDKSMLLVFLDFLWRIVLAGPRRREHYFTDAVEAAAMRQAVFQNLLYTIKDAGFARKDRRYQTIVQWLPMILCG